MPVHSIPPPRAVHFQSTPLNNFPPAWSPSAPTRLGGSAAGWRPLGAEAPAETKDGAAGPLLYLVTHAVAFEPCMPSPAAVLSAS